MCQSWTEWEWPYGREHGWRCYRTSSLIFGQYRNRPAQHDQRPSVSTLTHSQSVTRNAAWSHRIRSKTWPATKNYCHWNWLKSAAVLSNGGLSCTKQLVTSSAIDRHEIFCAPETAVITTHRAALLHFNRHDIRVLLFRYTLITKGDSRGIELSWHGRMWQCWRCYWVRDRDKEDGESGK